MPDLPSRLDLYNIGRQYVLSRATKIDPNQVDTEGSDVNIFVGVSAYLTYQTILQLGFKVGTLLLDTADDEDLERYAWDRYQLSIKAASAAVGFVRFFRGTGVGGAGSIPIGTKLNTLTGVSYITTSTATFGASTLEATAAVRAVQAGKESQVGRNQIRRFDKPPLIFDSTIELTNDDPTAHGEPREAPEDFRERIRNFWRTQRRGVLSAIEQGALTVPGVVSAMAVEVLTPTAQPARIVELYIADSSGVASQAIAAQVRAALLDYRAAGITVLVVTSLPQIVDVQLHLTFQADVDTLTLTEQIRAAVVGFVNSLSVNATLYRAKLHSALVRFVPFGLILNDATVVAPTGDLVPEVGKTLRTTITHVTVV